MRLFLMVMSVLALMGCKTNFDGVLDVYYPLELNSSGKSVELEEGRYETRLQIDSDSSLSLRVETTRDRVDTKIKLPEGSRFPRENGTFAFQAEELNQSFGIEGLMETEKTQSERRVDYIRCQTHGGGRVCYRDAHGRVVCYRTGPEWGFQRVEYYVEYSTQRVEIDFVSQDTQLAAFSSVEENQRRIDVYRGFCQ